MGKKNKTKTKPVHLLQWKLKDQNMEGIQVKEKDEWITGSNRGKCA